VYCKAVTKEKTTYCGLKEGLGVLLHAIEIVLIQTCTQNDLSCLFFGNEI
jgi:hypothetical protein